LKKGVLYVGRHAKTATISSFDLDGHPLETQFSFRDYEGGRSSAAGLAIDDDYRIWVADAAAGKVRAFTLFGVEVVTLGDGNESDVAGLLGQPVAVQVQGSDADRWLTIGSGGRRRHAVQQFHVESGRMLSLRPLGDPEGRFQDVHAVTHAGRFVYVCECRAGRIQVFRDAEFHFSITVPARNGAFRPVGLRVLSDGRLIVGTGGDESSVLLLDGVGRLLRVVAEAGREGGRVAQLSDIEVAEARRESATRLAVLDHDGERVQVFTLSGRCYGAFAEHSTG